MPDKPEEAINETRDGVARVVDGRNLEPPEPFEQTMDALDSIAVGQRVLLILGREPHPLYRALELNGYAWQTERKNDGSVEITIWHKPTQ
ncbi:MAG: DUF2249 domain-containing protein [Propionivibrio sp.]